MIGFPLVLDGIWGKHTINALNQANADILMDPVTEPGRPDATSCGVLIRLLLDYYITIAKRDPTQLANLSGWINRTLRVPI